MKIAHIVNPVNTPPGHELSIAQPITYETMRHAKKFAKKTKRMDIELWCTGYEEDQAVFPKGFEVARLLDKSILDYFDFGSASRKLPLFRHILDRLYEASDADYFIQTNVDIGLQPHFYTAVARLIDMGYDSLVINKRIISKHYKTLDDIPLMYSDMGTDHNGCDCFVFRREIYPGFILGDICMGTPWSETTLVANMVRWSSSVKFMRRPHLTFHIGDSRTWIPLADYRQHNTEVFAKCLTDLSKGQPDLIRHEMMDYFMKKMLYEIQDEYSDECHDLCAKVAMMF